MDIGRITKEKMGKRFEDWLKQAGKDLLHAKKSLEMQDYEWSCFSA